MGAFESESKLLLSERFVVVRLDGIASQRLTEVSVVGCARMGLRVTLVGLYTRHADWTMLVTPIRKELHNLDVEMRYAYR